MSKIKSIVTKLKRASDLYYNKGKSNLSDEEFDKLKDNLKSIAPGHSFLTEVGSPVDPNEKIELPVVMGSLSKLRPTEVKDWSRFIEGKDLFSNVKYHITPKYDGLSGLLHYKKGKLQAIYTRGNGYIGRNVIQKAKFIKGIFPNLFHCETYPKGDIYIKGEIVIPNSLFLKKYKSENYKNARNFCVGILNRKELTTEIKKVLKDMLFIVVSIEDKKGYPLAQSLTKEPVTINYLPPFLSLFPSADKTFKINRKPLKEVRSLLKLKNKSKALAILDKSLTSKNVGKTVYSQDINEQFIKDTLSSNLKEIDILQDGLVIRVLDNSIQQRLGTETNSLNPKWSKSIKLDQQDQDFQFGEVLKVEWNYTKRQLYKPLITLKEPLDFNGVEVTNISGQNERYILNNKIGEGSKLKIIRSGDVIPYITGFENESSNVIVPTKCGYCENELESTGVDLYCSNKKCPGLKYVRTVSFFTTLKTIEDVSDKTFQLLYDNGYTSVKKILKLTKDNLLKLDGFQERKSDVVYNVLQTCTKDTTLAQIMHASGFFNTPKTSLGLVKLDLCIDSLIEENLLNMDNLEDLLLYLDTLKSIIARKKGLSDKTAEIFIIGLPKFIKFFDTIREFVTFKEKEKIESLSSKLSGVVVVFTGFRNEELENTITLNGGEIGKGVTNKTTYLFAADPTTTKVKKAKEKNIPVISATDTVKFIENLLNN